MREDLGDGYTETLRAAYPEVPESADFVMYWWEKASLAVESGATQRFGLITTNSLRQTFNRRVLERHLGEISLRFAIPDHPWVDTQEGAAVRIAMTVAAKSDLPGQLLTVTEEEPQPDGSAKVTFDEIRGQIAADLTIGAKVSATQRLSANEGVATPGVKLHGSGFIVTEEEAKNLGLGSVSGTEQHIRPYRNGKDLADRPRGVMVIDLFGLTAEEVRERFPALYQHVLTRVKPERDQNKRESRKTFWWIFGEPNRELRKMLQGLSRYIATGETGKHRHFQFLDGSVLPDNMLIAIASDDAFHLGVLSSRIHVAYALAAGGRMGMGNDPRYNKTRCFDPFPFPDCNEEQKARIRALAEELDAHRKRVQAEHPTLTLTGIYNVLEALREGRPLTAKEKVIHDQGLVSVLRQLHDDLDAAVAEAYGWSANLSDEEILTRLVALNAERAAEESQGVIRYLRPEYQNPSGVTATQSGLNLTKEKSAKTKTGKSSSAKIPWPKPLAERVRAVEEALRSASAPVTAETLAKTFARASTADIQEILDTLVTLGRIHQSADSYSA
jgi:hypothetical protein